MDRSIEESGQKVGSEFLMTHLLRYTFGPDILHFMIQLTIKQIWNFFEKIKKQKDGCWEWTGCKSFNGYGRFQIHPKTYKAHKVSYWIFKGNVPDGKLVCHTCDHPCCVNPDHLWLGDPKDNTRDMIMKGRLIRDRAKHKDSASKYPGISFRKESKKWRARIMRSYKTVWCKEFSTQELAHLARMKALREYA